MRVGNTGLDRFIDKRVLVTGGTRGIGLATAQAFIAEGAKVVIGGKSEQSVEAAVASDGMQSAIGVYGDIAKVSDCELLVETAISKMDGLDILVNSAGVFQPASIEQTTEALWDNTININLKGCFFCSRAAKSALQESAGNIVHIASESGINGYSGSAAYCASKGAIVNMARSMAMELAPDIRVNTVCPGVVDTDMARAGFAIDGDEAAGMARQRQQYPLKRVATADEIAAAVLYLASDVARFITGESLVIDGGATVGK